MVQQAFLFIRHLVFPRLNQFICRFTEKLLVFGVFLVFGAFPFVGTPRDFTGLVEIAAGFRRGSSGGPVGGCCFKDATLAANLGSEVAFRLQRCVPQSP